MRKKDSFFNNRHAMLHIIIGAAAGCGLLVTGQVIEHKVNKNQEIKQSEQNIPSPKSEEESAHSERENIKSERLNFNNAYIGDYVVDDERPSDEEPASTDALYLANTSDDAICDAIKSLVEEFGTYTGVYGKAMYDDTRYAWSITDLSYRSDENQNFNGLFKYLICAKYATDGFASYGNGLLFEYEAGDPVWVAAYVEKKADCAVMHRVTVDDDVLLDDNYVPRNTL